MNQMVIAGITETHADLLREVNFLLCSAAFGGLLWRLIGRWMISYPLAKIIVGLFAALEFIVALGSARRAQLGGPLNEAAWAIAVHAVVTILVVIFWPKLLGLGSAPEQAEAPPPGKVGRGS